MGVGGIGLTVLAVIVTLAAWFVGLLFGSDTGLHIVLPMASMGAFLLEAIRRNKA